MSLPTVRNWNQMIFKVHDNPKHSTVLWDEFIFTGGIKLSFIYIQMDIHPIFSYLHSHKLKNLGKTNGKEWARLWLDYILGWNEESFQIFISHWSKGSSREQWCFILYLKQGFPLVFLKSPSPSLSGECSTHGRGNKVRWLQEAQVTELDWRLLDVALLKCFSSSGFIKKNNSWNTLPFIFILTTRSLCLSTTAGQIWEEIGLLLKMVGKQMF